MNRLLQCIFASLSFFIILVIVLSFKTNDEGVHSLSRLKDVHISHQSAGLDNDWFMSQRSYPKNEIPRNALTKAKLQMSAFRAGIKNPSGTWKVEGPSNIGGRITAVLIHPTDPNIVYAGSASGGVWRSTDFCVTWENIFNEHFSIGALAFDPLDPNIIYVGTGEANPAGVATYPGNGIWKTTNAGTTWSNIGLEQTGHIGKIVVNPLNNNVLYVAALGMYRGKTQERGVYKSTNAGTSWNRILFSNDTTGATDLLLDATDTNRVLAAMWTRYRTPQVSIISGTASGLFLSTDAGTSWNPVTNGFPNNDANLGRIALAVAPSNPSVLYALTAAGAGWDGVYISIDTGSSWIQTFNGSTFGEGQVWYNNIISVDPVNPSIIWTGMTSLYHSTDAGASFTYAPTYNGHVDHHAMQFAPSDPNIIVLGNDGGIFTSTDNGNIWKKSLNLPITQFYAGTVSALNPNRILGGTQDNGSLQTKNGVVNTWQTIYGGDGFYCLIDPTDSNYVYAEYQNGGLGYSTNGGGSFNSGTTGISPSDRKNWETPIAMDLQNPKTLYTGTHRMYRTTNNMQSWTAISSDLTYGNGGRVGTISTIDVSRTNSQVIYVGTDDGRVWVTTDGGSSWNEIGGTLPDRWVTRVTVDPDSANVCYVTLSGFIVYDWGGHVYRTNDYGATWTDIGTSLPDLPVNDVVVDPEYPSWLYIATDLNVMYTTNLGTSWQILGSDFPDVSVHDLAMHDSTRKLVAFTHGRSALSFDLTQLNPSSVNVPVSSNWNLVSLPVSGSGVSIVDAYPTAQNGVAYSFETSGYQQQTSLNSGSGYWMKFPASAVQNISGVLMNSQSVSVRIGWNLIGSISSSIPIANITSNPPGIVTTQFFGYNGAYSESDTIEPGKAYWVKVNQAGTLTLSSLVSPAKGGQDSHSSLGKIKIVTTNELPPPPPEGDGNTLVTSNLKPVTFNLEQNYPNPFNPVTVIQFSVPGKQYVSLKVYDVRGREVATLVNEVKETGVYTVQWDSRETPSGVYFYSLNTGTFLETKRMLLLR
ncbi:MAG: T9SS type A sorting domain-containing protein [Ignavibacteriae bacterium]|nr:T9SS type A sorting domain-containing protein [Ignavibacteriota bacterium]